VAAAKAAAAKAAAAKAAAAKAAAAKAAAAKAEVDVLVEDADATETKTVILNQVKEAAVLRILSPNEEVVGDLSVDFNRRQAHRGEERIRLTGMEFNLLELLISRSGEPMFCATVIDG
jgi:DNA-binding response OmpR family regulator